MIRNDRTSVERAEIGHRAFRQGLRAVLPGELPVGSCPRLHAHWLPARSGRHCPGRLLTDSPLVEGSQWIRAPGRMGARGGDEPRPLASPANWSRDQGAGSGGRDHTNGFSGSSSRTTSASGKQCEIYLAANVKSWRSTISRIARWPTSPRSLELPRAPSRTPWPRDDEPSLGPWRWHCESRSNRQGRCS